jgi:predicted RNase H-like nuclease (RuvC/YqgF family)
MLKKLKSLFIVEEDSPEKPPEQNAGFKQPSQSSREQESILEEIPDSGEAKLDRKFLDILLTSLEENNLKEFDYLEFKEFLKALDSMEMDEETKYKSAFANARTMGVTVEKLESTARHYLDVLKKEEQKFEAAVKSQRARIVEHKQTEVEKLEQSIEKKQRQIEQLKSEIDQHKLQMTEEQKAITQARAKIERTKNNFLFTYNTLIKQIKSDIQNINNYLKE